jgi:hypothetical protein
MFLSAIVDASKPIELAPGELAELTLAIPVKDAQPQHTAAWIKVTPGRF